jgi:hypothetical protein
MLKELIEFLTGRITVANPTVIQADDESPKVVLAPDGYNLKQLPGFIPPAPKFITENVHLAEPESFVEYVEAFNGLEPAIFSDVKNRAITAILDYHPDATTADRTSHSAHWAMQLDGLFAPWAAAHKQAFTHEAFVEFLDTNGDCIVSPTNQELLTMVEAIEVISSGSKLSFVSQSGDRSALKIVNEETIGQKVSDGTIVKPIRDLMLRVPVSQGGDPRDVRVNIHWGVRNGALAIRPTIHEYEPLLRAEFEIGESIIRGAELGKFFRGARK